MSFCALFMRCDDCITSSLWEREKVLLKKMELFAFGHFSDKCIFCSVCLCVFVCVCVIAIHCIHYGRKKLGQNLTFHIFSDKTTINQVKRGSSEETSKKFAFFPFRWNFNSKTGNPSIVKWLNCKQLKLTFVLNNFDQVIRKFESRCLHLNCLSTRFSDDFFPNRTEKRLNSQ